MLVDQIAVQQAIAIRKDFLNRLGSESVDYDSVETRKLLEGLYALIYVPQYAEIARNEQRDEHFHHRFRELCQDLIDARPYLEPYLARLSEEDVDQIVREFEAR